MSAGVLLIQLHILKISTLCCQTENIVRVNFLGKKNTIYAVLLLKCTQSLYHIIFALRLCFQLGTNLNLILDFCNFKKHIFKRNVVSITTCGQSHFSYAVGIYNIKKLKKSN